ncbi:MAG TPA: protease inhibitor I42 family protein [Syntrophorhabdaceae bacterium]|nr:protease inhibitor I42 family protein [Syntrophorhabdaceae bacterium]
MKKIIPWNKVIPLLVLWVAVALIVASPGISGDSKELPGKTSTYVDPKRAIQLKVGEAFSIVLDSNPATGYQWQLTAPPDDKIVRLVRSEYRASQTNLVGAGGEEIWTFSTVGPGQVTLAFKYMRPWEKDKEPERKALFKVYVFPRIKLQAH